MAAKPSLWKRVKTAPLLRGGFEGLFGALDMAEDRWVRRARDRYRRRMRTNAYGPRVLVVSRSGIGNLVEATPLVQAIRILWPQAWITVATAGGDLLENWCVPDCVTSDLSHLREAAFDHTFFPYWGWKGIPKVELPCELGTIHTVRLLHQKRFVKPERDTNVDMVRRLGYRGPTPPLYVSLSCPSDWTFRAPLNICMLAGGKETPPWGAKRWPFYADLSHRLLDAYPQAEICFLGTGTDAFPESLANTPRIQDLRDRFTLRQTAWVLKQADLAIGNDCGPMHIADAVQVPGLVLFGPTCELKNGPMYKGLALRADRSCGPCQYSRRMQTCRDSECMKNLSVETVFVWAGRQLERSHWRGSLNG